MRAPALGSLSSPGNQPAQGPPHICSCRSNEGWLSLMTTHHWPKACSVSSHIFSMTTCGLRSGGSLVGVGAGQVAVGSRISVGAGGSSVLVGVGVGGSAVSVGVGVAGGGSFVLVAVGASPPGHH